MTLLSKSGAKAQLEQYKDVLNKRNEAIAEAYSAGWTTKDIAEILGKGAGVSSPQTVANVLAKLGIALRSPGLSSAKATEVSTTRWAKHRAKQGAST